MLCKCRKAVQYCVGNRASNDMNERLVTCFGLQGEVWVYTVWDLGPGRLINSNYAGADVPGY